MRKKKEATIPKTTAWGPLLWLFLPENNRPDSKRHNNNNNNNNNNNSNNNNNDNLI